jgi:hypothetical protein
MLLVTATLLSAAPSLLADTPLGPARCAPAPPTAGCSLLSALRGRLLWTDFQTPSGQYVLLSRVGGSRGISDFVDVPGRLKPFDADLGLDASGRTVAVYSRCKGDPRGPARGCAVFEYDFVAARESRLAPRLTSSRPLLPSIWHSRLAVVTRSSASARARIRICKLPAHRGACRALPRGPLGVRPRTNTGPTAIDLNGSRVVFGWFYLTRTGGAGRRTEILLAPDVTAGPSGRLVRVARAGAGGAGSAAVFSPSIDRGRVYWARGGQTCDFPSTPNAAGRYDIARRRGREVRWNRRVHALAHGGSATYAVLCASAQPATDSMVARVDPDPFGLR